KTIARNPSPDVGPLLDIAPMPSEQRGADEKGKHRLRFAYAPQLKHLSHRGIGDSGGEGAQARQERSGIAINQKGREQSCENGRQANGEDVTLSAQESRGGNQPTPQRRPAEKRNPLLPWNDPLAAP